MILTKLKIKNIIFDLDGTLIDSSFDVIRILKQVLRENGALVDENTKIQIGPPLFDMVKNTAPQFSDDLARKVVEDYRLIYEKDELKDTVPFEGILEILHFLKDNDIKVFIATYKPKAHAVKTLDRYFDGLYVDIMTPSEVYDFSTGKTKKDILELLISKWGLNPEHCVMIGDARSDITCAKALGMCAIGALWGYGQEEEFESADEKISSVEDLKLVLGRKFNEK